MKKIPLKERLMAAAPQMDGSCPLAGATLPCVFQGAYLNCGKKYLSWLLKAITELYSASPGTHYEDVVFHAAERLLSTDDYCEEGYELLYQTTIEPFCLMAGSLGERKDK